MCGPGGPTVLGTFSRAAVCCVLCPLRGFAAPGGRCGLAPVLSPWLWPAACLSAVPRGPALVRRAFSSRVALSAPVGSPVAVLPSFTPGAVAPGWTGWLRGARGGGPRTGFIVPAAGLCRGRGAGRVPEPRDGVVPGGSIQLQSWAACAAVVLACVDPVTDASGFSYRPSFDRELRRCTGAVSCGRRHLPFQVRGRRTPVSHVCKCARFLSRVGRAGLPGAFWCASPFPVAVLSALFVCSAPFGPGSPFLWFLLLSSLSAPSMSPAFRIYRPWVPWALASCAPPLWVFFPSSAPPLVPGVPRFLALGALNLGVLSPSPPLGGFFFLFCFFFFSLCCAPLVAGLPCLSAAGALGLGVLCPPPPLSWFFCFFLFLRCGVPVVRCCVCVFWALGRVGVCCCGPCASVTYDFSSCFFPKFKIMHFQNRDIKLYTVVLLFLCFLNFFLKIMLSLKLEPQINCQQLPRTRVSDSRPPCAIEDRQKVHFFSQLEAK